jgi:coenzyme Q-binding protein COQ10
LITTIIYLDDICAMFSVAGCIGRRVVTGSPPIAQSANIRHFFSLPTTDLTQRLKASCTLPYLPAPLYTLISDVDSYSSFVPYCSKSRVTQWSQPDLDGTRWPTRADLHVGWGGFDEKFTSRLTCVPGQSVEAISGGIGEADASEVFKSLVTIWSLRPISENPKHPSTEVNLAITYHFANPLYAAVSSAVSDKVANIMIEAFKKQAAVQLRNRA